jgi:predicted acyl esterase
VRYLTWHLGAQKSGSVSSLNDGSLAREPAPGEPCTSYRYPDPGWMMGVVGFGPNHAPDPARRVLTFTTAPLDADLEIAGPILLTLYGSSSRDDMDVFVKLSEQMPQSPEERAKALNPAAVPVTKGWLRASHRALEPAKSTAMEPYHGHERPEPIEPGKVYRLDISLEPMAYRFAQGNRIRLEIVNGDSVVTDVLWTHYYLPSKIGADTIHHSAEYPSTLTLPVMEGG